MAVQEKPAVRPHWIDESDWDDTRVLGSKREELQKKIRARSGDQFEIEELIGKSGLISKRLRELNPPLQIPVDGRDDSGVRFHPPEVHQRALRMAMHSRNHFAHAATTSDTGELDRAALLVRRHHRGVAAFSETGAEETKQS